MDSVPGWPPAARYDTRLASGLTTSPSPCRAMRNTSAFIAHPTRLPSIARTAGHPPHSAFTV